jgi:LPXTG-motif cell wall-anchored protein
MKRRKVKRVLSVLLTGVLLLSLANLTALAADDDPTVIYNAATEEFSFRNVDIDENGGPDLFRDMKNLMPGDQLTQHIKVMVESIGNSTVTISVAATSTNGDYDTLLTAGDAPATLSVQYGDGSYAATLDETTHSLTLARFVGFNTEQEMDVTLSIPLEAGNELQNLLAQVVWVFSVDKETPYDPGDVTDIVVVNPTPPEPDPDIEDPDVPLSQQPDDTELPDGDVPLAELPEDDVPLAELPEDDVPLAELPEDDVPLASAPKTGDTSMVWLAAAILSACGLLWLVVFDGKGRKKEP